MTKEGDGILEGINDAIAYVKGDKSRGRASVIMGSNIDVKKIREQTGLSQEKFAETYGFSLSTLKKWESSAIEPKGPAKAYLTVIKQRPNLIKEVLHSAVS